VGRLARVKQLHLAIEAFATLKRAHPDATFIIAGDGEERGPLEVLARNRVPDGSVRFLGEITRQDVAAALRGSVALIMPSATEGFPIAAIESLACGTPVVCSATGALTEIIQDGFNGYFVNPHSTAGFVSALGKVIEVFPTLRQRCVESMQAFTAERIGARIEEKLIGSSVGVDIGGAEQPRPVSHT
jgi:glycosyltransferase involved in cell wall biosynthesis